MTSLPQYLSVLLLTGVSFVTSATAQSTLHMQRLRFDHSGVTAYLTLVDEDGTPNREKGIGDFMLQLDGERMEPAIKLTTFAQLKESLSVVAVVQLTATMDKSLDDVRKDVRQLAQAVQAVPRSRMGLVGYAADVKPLVEMEPSDRVLSALTKLTVDPPSPDARIVDAVRLAVDTLRLEDAAARKLVILFCDGKEAAYRKGDFLMLGDRAEQAGVVIDSIYYGSADSSRPRKMSELSKRSHGVERYVHSAAEGDRKLADLTHEINEQYAVTFSPEFSKPSHRFQVLLTGQIPIYGQVVEANIPTLGNPAPLPQPKARGRWLWGLFAGMLLLLAVSLLGRRFFRRGR